MPDLIMSTEFSEIVFGNHANLYKTKNLFGDVLYKLEKEYPKLLFDPNSWNDYIRNDLHGDNPFTLWGMSEGSSALLNMLKIIDNKSHVVLGFQDVEKLRLYYRFNSYQEYDGYDVFFENSDAIIFPELNTITQVLCAVLYYYSLNNLKISRCEHCNKWFATTSLKNKYCTRNSTVAGYTHLNCEQAVRNIKYQCSRKKNRIETKSYNANNKKNNYDSRVYSAFVYDFQIQCDKYLEKISQSKTAEILSEYMRFLDKVEKGKEWLNYGNDK